MHDPVGRAELLLEVRDEASHADSLAGLPPPEPDVARLDGRGPQLVVHAPRKEEAGDVGRQLDSCSDLHCQRSGRKGSGTYLAELLCLFEDSGLVSGEGARDGSRQAAETCAGNEDVEWSAPAIPIGAMRGAVAVHAVGCGPCVLDSHDS